MGLLYGTFYEQPGHDFPGRLCSLAIRVCVWSLALRRLLIQFLWLFRGKFLPALVFGSGNVPEKYKLNRASSVWFDRCWHNSWSY
ncbi:hypothetical protein D3C73_1028730 [compost metagenome]